MKKIKIGVMGTMRGASMINYCKVATNAEVVAICDKWHEGLRSQQEANKGLDIAYYDNFDDFIKHDMDAVVLANYANEHAPFAIRAMKAGKHVFSEVVPAQTMKEAVELIEAVEETGKIYAYGENYCYMPAPFEMKKLYKEGRIGTIEYADCEYLHNCESIWPEIAHGDKEHWRNNMYSTFYCTHSLGPIIHATGLRPVSVTGFECPVWERNLRVGRKNGEYGVEILTLENGAIVRSTHGNLYKWSNWYCLYGTKGRMESAREEAQAGGTSRIYISTDDYSGGYDTHKAETYMANEKLVEESKVFGHGGSDFYSMWHFVEKLRGNEEADIIDVYEAMDMFLPGHFAYRSLLAGGIPMQIPNLRDKAERERWRNDVSCTDPKVAGDKLWPCHHNGNPVIDEGVYEYQKRLWRKDS